MNLHYPKGMVINNEEKSLKFISARRDILLRVYKILIQIWSFENDQEKKNLKKDIE